MTAALQGLGFLIQAVNGALLGLDVQLQHLHRQTSLLYYWSKLELFGGDKVTL